MHTYMHKCKLTCIHWTWGEIRFEDGPLTHWFSFTTTWFASVELSKRTNLHQKHTPEGILRARQMHPFAHIIKDMNVLRLATHVSLVLGPKRGSKSRQTIGFQATYFGVKFYAGTCPDLNSKSNFKSHMRSFFKQHSKPSPFAEYNPEKSPDARAAIQYKLHVKTWSCTVFYSVSEEVVFCKLRWSCRSTASRRT